MPKKKEPKVDGLGPNNIKQIRAALRQIWHWSHAKKLVVQRCTDKKGFVWCELCKKKCPKLFVDHIVKVGDVDSGFIKRLFVSSKYMQGLCKPCHDKKTKAERAPKDFF